MIICGFPGVGKSTLAKFSNWVDLESTPFEKDWVRYAKVAKHMNNSGYNVMVSTHPQLLEQFEQMGAKYTVVVPPLTDISIYKGRYIRRGNDINFISLIEKNWDEWIRDIITKSSVNKTVVILPKDGCLQGYIEKYKGIKNV
jgi:UDP:flavonoid glycosyltransferase YjiC (YdhE family)